MFQTELNRIINRPIEIMQKFFHHHCTTLKAFDKICYLLLFEKNLKKTYTFNDIQELEFAVLSNTLQIFFDGPP